MIHRPLLFLGYRKNLRNKRYFALSYCMYCHIFTVIAIPSCKRYPVAGSLYSYVSYSLSKKILDFWQDGYFLLDYIFVPSLTSISAVLYLKDFFPHIPYKPPFVMFII